MSAFYVYFLLSLIIPIQFATASTPDDFWREYQTAKQTKTVKNLVDHVQTLSVRLDTDTGARLEQKKSAILYFMATGGKNGFRKTSATPAEKKVMENALIFATLVHEFNHGDQLLPIMTVRRNAGFRTEDLRIKKHLAKAQGIITATRIMLLAPKEPLKDRIHNLFNREYLEAFLDDCADDQDRDQWRVFLEQWQKKAKEFSSIFTLEFLQQAKLVFDSLKITSYNPNLISVPDFKIPETQSELSDLHQLLLANCTTPNTMDPGFSTPPPSRNPVSHKPMKVITENGLSIERGANGSVHVFASRDIKIGSLHLTPGGGFGSNTGLYLDSIELNQDQTEEEFLAAISAFSAIVEKTYI